MRLAIFAALMAAVTACSPTLDWRAVRPVETAASLLMPCRPSEQVRQVALAGEPRRLSLLVCTAGGQTWGFAHADLGDPTEVGTALEALLAAAAANIQVDPQDAAAQAVAITVPGATPNDANRRVVLSGRMPDGTPVQSQVAVFAYGTVVHQATVLGPAAGQGDADTFFGSLRVGR